MSTIFIYISMFHTCFPLRGPLQEINNKHIINNLKMSMKSETRVEDIYMK